MHEVRSVNYSSKDANQFSPNSFKQLTMPTSTTYAPRQVIRLLATGVLLSIVSFYLLHFFGTWNAGIDRPDAETTSSVLVYNKCAVLGDVHILRPAASSSNKEALDDIKAAGSFMNFFDGHIVAMIALGLLLAILMLLIRKAAAR